MSDFLPRHLPDPPLWARLFRGATAPIQGFLFLAGRPNYWPWLAIPVVLFALAVIPTAWWLKDAVPAAITGWSGIPENPFMRGLWVISVWILTLVAFVGVAAAEWVVVSVVSRPAYDAVAEWVESEATGVSFPKPTWGELVVGALWAGAHSVMALGIYAVAGLVVMGFALIPLLGELIAPLLWTLVTSLWLARELIDGPLSRRQWAFGKKLALVRRRWPELFGLGFTSSLLFVVPIVDLVALPAAFVGGTLLYSSLVNDGRER